MGSPQKEPNRRPKLWVVVVDLVKSALLVVWFAASLGWINSYGQRQQRRGLLLLAGGIVVLSVVFVARRARK